MGVKGKASKKTKTVFNGVAVLFFVAIIGILAFSILSTQIDISNKKAELAELKAKTGELKIINEEYRSLLESCDTDGYIERIAREKLDYVYPEERIYIDRSGK